MKHLVLTGVLVLALLPAAASGQGLRLEALGGSDRNSFGDRGVLYGARAGYDFALTGRLSLGVDGEVNDVTTDQSLEPILSLKSHDGPEVYAGARVSFEIVPRLRLVGAAGISNMQLGEFRVSGFGTPNEAFFRHEYRETGFRLSAGAQIDLGRRTFLGAEYRYSEYGNFRSRDQFVASVGVRF